MPKGTGGVWGFNYTSGVLERTLDALGLQQRVTAHNVANVNTPGFLPRQVSFEESLQEALEKDKSVQKSAEGLAPNFAISVEQQPGAAARPGGSGVDIDKEMVDLSKAVVKYNATTTLVTKLYTRVSMAIKEGRR